MMEPVWIVFIILSSPKYIVNGAIISYISNVDLKEFTCFIAPKSMIHLHMVFDVFHVALQIRNYHHAWWCLHSFGCCILFCSKNMKCGLIFYNNNTSRYLCMKMDYIICLDTTPLWHHHIGIENP